jgi:hypothetical protein
MNNGFTHEKNSKSNSVEWYTPAWLFQKLGLEFDLDPAAPKGGLPWIPAQKFYCKEDDGLVQPWHGLVWLNPPYGAETGKWLKRMHEHRQGIALVFSRTDSRWFHDYATKADAILYVRRRIRFVDANGETGKSSPGCGSILIGWGGDAVSALETVEDELGHLELIIKNRLAIGKKNDTQAENTSRIF